MHGRSFRVAQVPEFKSVSGSPVIHTGIPPAVTQSVLSSLGIVAVYPISPGMSGASVFRCQLHSGDSLALKCWPKGTALARVREVHHVMRQAKTSGCECIPRVHAVTGATEDRPETVFTCQNRHWELTQWMPGQPPSATEASQVTLDQVRAGASVIARFHHAGMVVFGSRAQSPPAAMARLKRSGELDSLIPQAVTLAGRLTAPGGLPADLRRSVQDASRLLQRNWNEVSGRIARSLSQYVDQKATVQYVLRDIHREHILFSDGKPTGLIDFDAIRVDTPATDLARWVGSFFAQKGSSSDREVQQLWDAALAGFDDEGSLKNGGPTEFDVSLARHLCFATTWISLGNWLVWILCQRREFPAGPKAVAARIRELIDAASLGF